MGDISGWGRACSNKVAISQGGGYLRVGICSNKVAISQGGGYLRGGGGGGEGSAAIRWLYLRVGVLHIHCIPHTVHPRHNHTHRTHPQTTLCLTWITCGCASRICPAPCWLEYTDILARVVPTMILGPCGPGQAKRLVASAMRGVEDMCPVCREGRWREYSS